MNTSIVRRISAGGTRRGFVSVSTRGFACADRFLFRVGAIESAPLEQDAHRGEYFSRGAPAHGTPPVPIFIYTVRHLELVPAFFTLIGINRHDSQPPALMFLAKIHEIGLDVEIDVKHIREFVEQLFLRPPGGFPALSREFPQQFFLL